MKNQVQNMRAERSGRDIPNQFKIFTNDGKYFQSYSSIIIYISNDGEVTLDRDKWDYSKTTSKYRNMFLGESKKETEAKIKSGQYKLADLN
jgi:hypothetical protein